MLPEITFLWYKENPTCGFKKNKERITVAVYFSAEGTLLLASPILWLDSTDVLMSHS